MPDRRELPRVKLCRGCGCILADVLVRWGEEYHVCCGPDRKPMTLKVIRQNA